MRLTDSISLRKNGLFVRAFAYVLYIIVRKLSVPMVNAVVMSALYCCVFVVFLFSANAKMIGIHARRIVAGVHDYFASRNFPFEKFIRISMRSDGAFSLHQKDSVPIAIFCAFPKPARFCFFNSIKKNILGRKYFEFIKTLCFPHSLVTRSAKFATNRVFCAADNAGNSSSNLICHTASY